MPKTKTIKIVTQAVTFETLLEEYYQEALKKKLPDNEPIATLMGENARETKAEANQEQAVTFETLLEEYYQEALKKKLPDNELIAPLTEERAQQAKTEKTLTEVAVATAQDENIAETAIEDKKNVFKLTPPENNAELLENMCVKRGRKLIYAPKEVIYDASFTVIGTNKKNEEGIRVKDILEAEIKEGTRLGYLDKYDGLKTSEIKEEYEDDIIYEYAEQEFKKMGIIYDGKKLKVYVYDWDAKACHHVGYIDENEASESIKYFSDKEEYSFDLCGIITGGKGKRVTKTDGGKIVITKEKGGDYGIDLDITVIARKD